MIRTKAKGQGSRILLTLFIFTSVLLPFPAQARRVKVLSSADILSQASSCLDVISDTFEILKSRPAFTEFYSALSQLSEGLSLYRRLQFLGPDLPVISEREQELMRGICDFALLALEGGDSYSKFQAVSILNHAISLIADNEESLAMRMRVKGIIVSYLRDGDSDTKYHAIEAASNLALDFLEIDSDITAELIAEIVNLLYAREDLVVDRAMREIIYLTDITEFPEHLRRDAISQLLMVLGKSNHSSQMRGLSISCLRIFIDGDMSYYDDVSKVVSFRYPLDKKSILKDIFGY